MQFHCFKASSAQFCYTFLFLFLLNLNLLSQFFSSFLLSPFISSPSLSPSPPSLLPSRFLYPFPSPTYLAFHQQQPPPPKPATVPLPPIINLVSINTPQSLFLCLTILKPLSESPDDSHYFPIITSFMTVEAKLPHLTIKKNL